jgi:hypothetical protein
MPRFTRLGSFFDLTFCTDSTFVHNYDFFVYKICTKVFFYNLITY